MSTPARQRFDFASYVLLEEQSPNKHEFLDGQVWAMAGGSPAHAALIASLARLLGNQLDGRPCRVFSSDLRIRVRETGLATYPDLSVVCGKIELDPEDPKGHTATNPRLLVEVLSPSTEDYDRGEKLAHYKRIPGLREVVLVAQAQPRVEQWSRQDDDSAWIRAEFHEHDLVPLRGLTAELSLVDLYRDPLA
jgi:Uma2 family endonuclease